MAPKTAEKPVKPSRKKVTVKPPPTEDLDRDGMLREACGGMQRQADWNLLRFGGATNNSILDLLADIWGGGWGHSDPEKGWTWCAKGGAKPGIWFGIPSPIGPASLTGEKLAAAVRRLMEIPEPGTSPSGPGIDAARTETDDELLLRALDPGHDRWRLARENTELPDGELYQLLKISWKKPVTSDGFEGGRIRAFYARAFPYPAVWFDTTVPTELPTLGTADADRDLLAEVRRVLDLPGQQSTDEPAAEIPAKPIDRDARLALLRRALLGMQGAGERWAAVFARVPHSPVDILDQLGFEWQGNPGYDGPDGEYSTRGGKRPAIWFRFPADGKPDLSGGKLVDHVRELWTEGKLTGQAVPEPPPDHPVMESAEVAIEKIRVVKNDRKVFDQDELEKLAASFGGPLGILQPLLVGAPDGDGMYPLIAGERRLRAARIAGLSTVPVRIGAFDDRETALARLTENLLRVDLNAMEEAQALSDMLQMGVTQRQLAERLKIGQSTIAHRVNLLKLPETLQAEVISGKLTTTQARTLAAWADRPAVIAAFENAYTDEFGEVAAEALLAGVLYDHSRAMEGHAGPLFKETEELTAQLDVQRVKVGGLNELRAFNTQLWDEKQQHAIDLADARKAGQAAAKSAAATAPKSASPQQAEPERAPAARLTDPQVRTLWVGWFCRALVAKLTKPRLSVAEHEAWLRAAVVFSLSDYISEELKAACGISGSRYGLHTTPPEELFTAMKQQLLVVLQGGDTYRTSFDEIRQMAEGLGITLARWSPDAEFLAAVPEQLLKAWIAEFDVTPARDADSLRRQLLEDCWPVGWIPDELNLFPTADSEGEE